MWSIPSIAWTFDRYSNILNYVNIDQFLLIVRQPYDDTWNLSLPVRNILRRNAVHSAVCRLYTVGPYRLLWIMELY